MLRAAHVVSHYLLKGHPMSQDVKDAEVLEITEDLASLDSLVVTVISSDPVARGRAASSCCCSSSSCCSCSRAD